MAQNIMEQLEDGMHAIQNYYALMEQHERLEAEIYMDKNEQQRLDSLCGTLSSFISTIPEVDKTKLADVVKSKLPIRVTNLVNKVDVSFKQNSLRLVARTMERRRRRIQSKIADNEADLEEFTANFDAYLPLRVPFKNEAAVRQYNTLRADLSYCYKKKEEYQNKMKEVDEILNSIVIDTTIDEDTTEESSIDEF